MKKIISSAAKIFTARFRFILLSFAVIPLLLCSIEVVAQQKNSDKLGKILVRAATTKLDGQEVPDADREESSNDIKKRIGKFILTDKESEADFLLVINERTSTPSGVPYKNLVATLYVRESGEWKPTIVLKTNDNYHWRNAAINIIGKAEKWVNANRKRQ